MDPTEALTIIGVCIVALAFIVWKMLEYVEPEEDEEKLWKDYKIVSKSLIEFYEEQDQRNENIKYADDSSLKDNMWKEGSILSRIKKINEEL